MRSGWRFSLGYIAVCLIVAGCAARRISLPADPGSPLPDFAAVHQAVSAACSGVRTFTLELALSGRAGEERLRGRVVAGFARPESMRLEGVAPFGAPAFILVSQPEEATLLLPRNNAVLRDAAAEDIMGALTGVTLAPADLQAILTGCVVPDPVVTSGRLHADGWASLALQGGATVFLRRSGNGWQVRAARRDGWEIEYPGWQGRFPQTVRLRSDVEPTVDLTAALSQIEANVTLADTVFTVNVPAGARELTLTDIEPLSN